MMPNTPKGNRKGAVQEPKRNRKNRLLKEKSSSFHGRIDGALKEMKLGSEPKLRRPHTLPDLVGGRSLAAGTGTGAGVLPGRMRKPMKLLFNVMVQGSVGAVQVLMSPEATVGELIAFVVKQYGKEGRRPILVSDLDWFGLHYSQFSLESLGKEEKLVALGSRNFFLCPKKHVNVDVRNGIEAASSSCSKEVEKANNKNGFAWLKFMDFLK